MTNSPLEAECKFVVSDLEAVRTKLENMNALFQRTEEHRDTYLRHPSRDFRQSKEALRIREVNGMPWVTYKGPKLSGPIKIRPEIELPLVPDTVEEWLRIWNSLGFQIAATVEKSRDVYSVQLNERALTVTLDTVQNLGTFAEIERILDSETEIQNAQKDIMRLASLLGLTEIETRSYLGLLLFKNELE